MSFDKLKPIQNLTSLHELPHLSSLHPEKAYTPKYLSQAELFLLSVTILSHAKQLINTDFENNQQLIRNRIKSAQQLLTNNYFDNLMTNQNKKELLNSLSIQ